MHSRCYNPGNIGWEHYGGRGIQVCQRWHKFEAFLADMGEPPTLGHSLDRKNNNLGYSEANCRWATKIEQDNNRSSNRRFTYQGRTLTVKQWADEVGLKYATLYRRLCVDGWPVSRALGLRPDGA